MKRATIEEIAQRALPLMSPENRAEAAQLLAELHAEPETLAEWTKRAAAAFEHDMQPVCTVLAQALHEGDLAALRGLRGMLAPLLLQVNAAPALADLLAHQLGAAVLGGIQEELQRQREEAL